MCVLISIQGCGTFLVNAFPPETGHIPYAGVYFSAKGVVEFPQYLYKELKKDKPRNKDLIFFSIMPILGIVDIPLSFALDTLLLPYNIYNAYNYYVLKEDNNEYPSTINE